MADSSSSVRWLLCGASAGLVVDLTLYPLDTIKTRLQSANGFKASGGFRSLYSGMGSVAVGSAPGSAVFFLSYKLVNRAIGRNDSLSHALSAGVGEVLACTIRVPTELIKQRAQADSSRRLSSIFLSTIRTSGFFGLFRGYGSTVSREIPFSLIQFPIWEALKRRAARRQGTDECSPLASAVCGSVAGAIAAASTTPLDVVKTRIMLGADGSRRPTVIETLRDVYRSGGVRGLFAGIGPRSLWISVGGFIFFGVFDATSSLTKGLL